MSNSSIWPIDRTLSGATTLGQSGSWSNGNEGVLYIPQSSSITGASLSDCLVSYSKHSLEESYSSVEMQSVYVTAPADWAITYLKTNYISPPLSVSYNLLIAFVNSHFKAMKIPMVYINAVKYIITWHGYTTIQQLYSVDWA